MPPAAMACCLSASSYLIASGLIIGDAPVLWAGSIRRSIFRLRWRALRRSLAFTRNPRLRVWIEVLVTSNTHEKHRGFSSFLDHAEFNGRLFKN